MTDPRFDPPTKEPQFQIDSFEDLVYSEDGKGHPAKIDYEYCYYEGACHVYRCEVSTSLRHVIQDDIYEALRLRHGKNVSFECQINFV